MSGPEPEREERVGGSHGKQNQTHRLGVTAMKGAEQRISEAERAFQSFESLRRRVDANLAKPGSERDAEVVKAFAPAITDLIEVAANRLRLTQER